MTRKKTRYKLRPSDVIVFLLCISVCLCSLYFFWKDLNHTTKLNDREEIAHITFKYNISQRKFSDRVVWERLQQNSPLYNEDTVRTSNQALATIHFNNGTQIEVYENTMLQLFSTKEGVKLTVGGGAIDVDTSTTAENENVTLELSDGTQAVMQQGTKLTAKNDETEGIKLQTNEGSVNITTQSGQQELLNAGEAANLNSAGQIKKESLVVTSISDNVMQFNYENEETKPVELKWKTSDKKKIIVEASKTKDFSQLEAAYEVTDADSVVLPSNSDVLYWRVYEEDNPSQVSDGKIVMQTIPALTPVSPQDNLKFKYTFTLPKIIFNWKGNSYADYYRLVVSKVKDLRAPLIDRKIYGQSVVIDTLDAGEYFWQVTPYYSFDGSGYHAPTQINSFIVEKQETINPPSLVLPALNAKVYYENNTADTSFVWKSDISPAEYKLEVSRTEDFSKVVLTQKTTAPRIPVHFEITSVPEGEYFWRVTRTSSQETGPAVSEKGSFTLQKYVPGVNRLVYPPDGYQIEEQKLKAIGFSWKLADEYKGKTVNTKVQFSPYEDFYSEIKEFDTQKQQISNIALEAGTYFWRIAVPKEKSDGFNYSEPNQLQVLKPLKAPELISPKHNEKVVSTKDTKVTITWNSISGADYYRLTVKDKASDQIIQQDNYTSNKAVINTQLKNGSYTVALQAVCKETEKRALRVSEEAVTSFTVREVTPVRLVALADGSSVSGINALRKPVTLTWEALDDKPVSSEFVLRKLQSDGTLKQVQTIKNPKTKITLERLTPGKYYWTIRATAADGSCIDAQKEFTFTVNSIPPLAKPYLMAPQNNLVMGPAYLKKNRSITFSWKAVEGATDYSIVIYRKTSASKREKIYEQKKIKGAQYKFTQMSLLDVGTFEWEVTAYSHAKDGYEEQKSPSSSAIFKIDFSMPGEVENVSPQNLYGE